MKKDFALIGAGAIITKDVKPYSLMAGVPAKQIGWVGQSGNTLHFDEQNIAIDHEYRHTYKLVNGQVDIVQ